MLNPIPLSLTLLGATLLAASAGYVATFTQPADSDPIARLDECIQRRFLGTRTLGITRVLPNRYHGVQQFQPEDAAEQKVVVELAQKGYRVAWFLAGRHVLDTRPAFEFSGRYGLQGPAYIVNTTAASALPDRESLLAEGRQAMKAFANQRGGYDVQIGEWVVAMRPLRAINESCVRCHTVGPGTLIRDDRHRPGLGDALGVAMYVYRREN